LLKVLELPESVPHERQEDRGLNSRRPWRRLRTNMINTFIAALAGQDQRSHSSEPMFGVILTRSCRADSRSRFFRSRSRRTSLRSQRSQPSGCSRAPMLPLLPFWGGCHRSLSISKPCGQSVSTTAVTGGMNRISGSRATPANSQSCAGVIARTQQNSSTVARSSLSVPFVLAAPAFHRPPLSSSPRCTAEHYRARKFCFRSFSQISIFVPLGAVAVSPSSSLSEAIFRLAPGHFQQERERERVREPSSSFSSARPRPLFPPPALAYGCLGGERGGATRRTHLFAVVRCVGVL
jgi:hypothetical protein